MDSVPADLRLSSRPVVPERGGMDDLAAAAAVVAIDVDPENADIDMLDSTQGSQRGAGLSMPACEVPVEEKENHGDLPVDRGREAKDLKVMLAPTSLRT